MEAKATNGAREYITAQRPGRESERPIVAEKRGNARGAKGPYWKHDSVRRGETRLVEQILMSDRLGNSLQTQEPISEPRPQGAGEIPRTVKHPDACVRPARRRGGTPLEKCRPDRRRSEACPLGCEDGLEASKSRLLRAFRASSGRVPSRGLPGSRVTLRRAQREPWVRQRGTSALTDTSASATKTSWAV